MPKPDNTLDEILSTHLNEIKAGHHGKLRQAILQWVADEVIGAHDSAYSDNRDRYFEHIMHQNNLRTAQRDVLKQHGWEEPTK